jgi:hypothetical protein
MIGSSVCHQPPCGHSKCIPLKRRVASTGSECLTNARSTSLLLSCNLRPLLYLSLPTRQQQSSKERIGWAFGTRSSCWSGSNRRCFRYVGHSQEATSSTTSTASANLVVCSSKQTSADCGCRCCYWSSCWGWGWIRGFQSNAAPSCSNCVRIADAKANTSPSRCPTTSCWCCCWWWSGGWRCRHVRCSNIATATVWPATVWPTTVWSAAVWSAAVWPTTEWPATVWPTTVWPTTVWSATEWSAAIRPAVWSTTGFSTARSKQKQTTSSPP